MPADGVVPPVLDLNNTPMDGNSSAEHNKRPHALDEANLPAIRNVFGELPTLRMDEEVRPNLIFHPVRTSQMVSLCHCTLESVDDEEDYVMTSMETQNVPACIID
jgi:hypothetical protein